MPIKGLCASSGRVGVVALLLVASCGGAAGPPPRSDPHPIPAGAQRLAVGAPQGGVLRYPMPGEPRSFNPLMVVDTRSLVVARLTTATLLGWDPVEQRVTDGLAASRGRSEDGRTVTIELREGVRFSDGAPLTSEDVVFTFEKIYAEQSSNALRGGLTPGGQQLEVRATGERSLEVVFPRATPAAEFMLSSVPVLPRHRLEGPGPIDERWTVGTAPQEFAGLGPFVVASHEPGLRTVLRRNPHYWKLDSEGRRLPFLDEVVLEYVQDRNAQLLRFQSGQLDIVDQQLRPEDIDFLASSGSTIETSDLGPSGNVTLLWFNLSRERAGVTVPISAGSRRWFADVRFRRAVSSAINRQAIVDNIYGGRATAATALVPSSARLWHAPDLEVYGYDPARAREILQHAGFSWIQADHRPVLVDARATPVVFGLIVKADEVLGRSAAIIQQDLAELGIHVTIQQEEMGSIISRVTRSRDYEAVLTNFDLPFNAVDFEALFNSSGPMHLWDPLQPEPLSPWERRLDVAMSTLLAAADHESRYEAFTGAQQIIASEVPVIPIVNRNVLLAWQRRVRNLRPANQFPYSLWNSWELAVTAAR